MIGLQSFGIKFHLLKFYICPRIILLGIENAFINYYFFGCIGIILIFEFEYYSYFIEIKNCYYLFIINYRHPCVATVTDYVLLLFIFILFFFYSPFVFRNYSTDSHQIFRNCVFWCSLNNPVVLKFFWRHLAEKNVKNSENFVKISRVDSDFWQ